ncbi:DNA polymerase domain-containing protein [Candidatus Harpocratesius sp.]
MRKRNVLDPCWILDANPHPQGIELWLKDQKGNCQNAIFPFNPSFYAVFSPTKYHIQDFSSIHEKYKYYALKFSEYEEIKDVSVVERRIHAHDDSTSLCLKITPISPTRFKRLIKFFRSFDFFDLYNTDIPVVQIFFYEKKFFPFARCRAVFSDNLQSKKLKNLVLLDSNESVDYEHPPLRILWFEIKSKLENLARKKQDQIYECRLTLDPDSKKINFYQFFPDDMIWKDNYGNLQLRIREAKEYETLLELERAIKLLDPDIIFTIKGDELIFPYLIARLKALHLDRGYSLSRKKIPISRALLSFNGSNSYMSYGQIFHRSKTQFYLHGRLHIDSAIMGGLNFSDGNLYGIVEVARISYVTLQRLTRITIGGALQSMQFFHAYQQDILIPEEKKNVEHFRQASTLLFSDRGGHILNPKVGMFENVAELDFTSMYPALMVKYNVSPEKINCKCCDPIKNKVPGLPYHICQKSKGIVPLSLELPLKKRIIYKNRIKHSSPDLAKRYSQMQSALKWILVVCFGYLGFRNARFGRIEAHQAVCAYSREFLLQAMEIVEKHGIIFLHGIVDSLYVQAPKNMPISEFHQRCISIVNEIKKKTKIPIEYTPASDYFKFITFLPTKEQPKIGALNRYWGIKHDGKIKVRGIELRRHDSPPFIKLFQQNVITAIANSTYRDNSKKLLERTILPILFHFFERLDSREVLIDDLAITIRLTRNVDEYKVNNYQVIAARHLAAHGKKMGPGQKISFIITDDQSQNPLDKALPIQFYLQRDKTYDVLKYRELLVRAMNNLLPEPLSKSEQIFLSKYRRFQREK